MPYLALQKETRWAPMSSGGCGGSVLGWGSNSDRAKLPACHSPRSCRVHPRRATPRDARPPRPRWRPGVVGALDAPSTVSRVAHGVSSKPIRVRGLGATEETLTGGVLACAGRSQRFWRGLLTATGPVFCGFGRFSWLEMTGRERLFPVFGSILIQNPNPAR